MRSIIRRFPFETAFALLGTLASIVLIEISDLHREQEAVWIRVLCASGLGLVLSLSATLFAESRLLPPGRKVVLRLVPLALALVFFLALNPAAREADFLRFFLLAAAFHLLVSFAAFSKKPNVHAFWEFNKSLFLRVLTGGLYAAVLFAGISAAIAALNALFNLGFSNTTYSILFALLAGLFFTFFFLAGVPSVVTGAPTVYPKGLKVFTQYVLIPLATLYVLILLAYEVKILVEWNLPKGMVSALILGYAVFGILSQLLVYPIRHLEENKWINTYSKSFYFLMVPLIMLLIVAIITRIGRYGITEERYFLIMLALWLSFISAWFLVSKNANILIIPISLCAVILVSVYGPQSAFSVSRRSQQAELVKLFSKYGAFSQGLLQPLQQAPAQKDESRMKDVIRYLANEHGIESLQPVVAVDVKRMSDSLALELEKKKEGNLPLSRHHLQTEAVVQLFTKLNFSDTGYYSMSAGDMQTARMENSRLIAADQADYLVPYGITDSRLLLNLQGDTLQVESYPGLSKVALSLSGERHVVNPATLISPLSRYFKQNPRVVEGAIEVPDYLLQQQLRFKGYSIRIQWTELSFTMQRSTKKVHHASGFLLIRKLKES